MSEDKPYALVHKYGWPRTFLVLVTYWPSIEAARAAAISRAAESMPWYTDGQRANAVEPLQSLTVGQTVEVNGDKYSIET